MTLIQVRAVPMGDDTFMVECSDCGMLTMEVTDEVDAVCIGHLKKHNVDTSAYEEDDEEN